MLLKTMREVPTSGTLRRAVPAKEPPFKSGRTSHFFHPLLARWALGVILGLFLLLFRVPPLPAGVNLSGAHTLADLSLEELMDLPVVGASKYPQKLREAPASVTIITREDIKRYGYRTLADILRSVPGFFVTDDRNYQYLGIRGFNRPGDYNSRFLLLLDGHRLNDPIYQMAPIGRDFPLDVDLIDRVEVIRGPSFALYGSGAFFAVINVITLKGADLKGVEVSGAAGSFLAHQGRLSYGRRLQNGLEMMVSGSYFNSFGADRLYFPAFDRPDRHNGLASHCDYEMAYSFFTKLAYRNLSLTAAYGSRTKGIPTGSFNTTFNDSRNKTLDTSGFLDLKYERTWPSDWGLLARLSYNFNTYDGYYWYTKDDAPFKEVLNRDLGRSQWLGGELHLTKKVLERHKFIVGGEFQQYLDMLQKNYDASPWRQYLNDRRQGNLWALFAQGELVLTPKLRLFAGVRFDHYSACGGTVNPKAALVFQPLPATTLKLLYNEGFRAPNAMELYYQDGGYSTKANPHLKPEKIRALEAVWEQKLTSHWVLKTSGFYYRVEGLVTQVVDPADGLAVFRNFKNVEAYGLEAELNGRWRFLDGRLSYSFQQVRDLETGQVLNNCPNHLAKLHLLAPLYRDKLLAGLEMLFTSPRRTLAGGKVGAQWLTNLTLMTRNLVKGLEVSASIYNLFNQKYYDPGSLDHLSSGLKRIPQDGLTFRIKATYNF
jgi:outer membrane receptor for ferrienterochelin and colicins